MTTHLSPSHLHWPQPFLLHPLPRSKATLDLKGSLKKTLKGPNPTHSYMLPTQTPDFGLAAPQSLPHWLHCTSVHLLCSAHVPSAASPHAALQMLEARYYLSFEVDRRRRLLQAMGCRADLNAAPPARPCTTTTANASSESLRRQQPRTARVTSHPAIPIP